MTPAEIARSLTEAQRTMFLEAEPYGDWVLIRWPNRYRPNGWLSKKLSLYWNPDYDSLTDLGLAIRAELAKER